MFHGITSSSCRKSVLISLSSIGKSQQPYLDDLETVGFKDFNPMWSFPTTSVNQNWESMTFGMAPWHLVSDKDRSKEALQSQSPIAAFKACNVIPAIGIAYSKIVLPSSDTKGESKNRTYCPTAWNNSYTSQYICSRLCRSIASSSCKCTSVQGMYSIDQSPAQQEECKSSKLRIVRFSEHRHVWCNDQLDTVYCSEGRSSS